MWGPWVSMATPPLSKGRPSKFHPIESPTLAKPYQCSALQIVSKFDTLLFCGGLGGEGDGGGSLPLVGLWGRGGKAPSLARGCGGPCPHPIEPPCKTTAPTGSMGCGRSHTAPGQGRGGHRTPNPCKAMPPRWPGVAIEPPTQLFSFSFSASQFLKKFF